MHTYVYKQGVIWDTFKDLPSGLNGCPQVCQQALVCVGGLFIMFTLENESNIMSFGVNKCVYCLALVLFLTEAG